MQRETKIYVLRDPRTNEVRYVGKTVKTLRTRLSGHIHCSKTKDTYRDRWVASLLAAGVRPIIEQIEVAGADWAERECFWISHYRNAGARLVNHTDGGEGTCGLVHTPEFRKEQSLRVKAAMTAERRAQHSAAMKRVAADPLWLERHALKIRERAADPAYRAAMSERTKSTMTPERRAQMSEITKRAMTPERIEAQSRKLKETTSDPEWRARQSATIKAIMTPERRAAIGAKTSETMTPERRLEIAEKQRAVAADPEYKARQRLAQKQHAERLAADPVASAERSQKLKAGWTPERRAAAAERMRATSTARWEKLREGIK